MLGTLRIPRKVLKRPLYATTIPALAVFKRTLRLPKARQDKAAERETFLDYSSAVGALASSLHKYPCSGPSAEGTCTEFFSKPVITACHCKDTYLVESRPGLFSCPSPPSPQGQKLVATSWHSKSQALSAS